jgi:3-hydroxybutyryl-CoA dehydrogenase
MATSKPTAVYLIGDASLVEEFGKCCHDAGVIVTGKVPQRPNDWKRPKFLKPGSTIASSVVCCFELTNSDPEQKKKNLRFLEQCAPKKSVICSSSVIFTAAEQASWMKAPPRLVGIGAFPTLIAQPLTEIAPTRHTDARTIRSVTDFFGKIGKETAIVQDRVGMVMPRILCMLINEAAFALTEQIASPQDIDAAMKLGTNYPSGPVEWGDRIGFSNVLQVLNALNADLHEERYRAAPLLQQLSGAARWWGT